jgi:hypothetical protein
MRPHFGIFLVTVGLALGVTPNVLAGAPTSAHAGEPTFATIDPPGANLTIAADINPAGDIVGRFVNADAKTCPNPLACPLAHGFLLRGGEFTTIDFPDALFSSAIGINPHGDIVGRYRNPGEAGFHGFLLSENEFTSIDFPGAIDTRARGINPRGDVVGDYCAATPCSTNSHGFLLSEGEFTSIDFPGAVLTAGWRINAAGEIVGRYQGADGKFHVFLLRDGPGGQFTTIDVLGLGAVETAPGPFSDGGGINPRGDIVSDYCDAAPCSLSSGNVHGFLLSRGEFIKIDFPGAVSTIAFGINPRGDIVGPYLDRGGKVHGYLTTARR